ncbi:imidazole glycerol phosphate synthase subunit HisH [Gynurincola endophyticus]|jgi:glutamine amidotransferase|uniref:imidazole glycerol phosphate synthase subunit HisH n=1 Tax=Gynurincola endophyticus TaxID=2479004 RepID=UPI000F8D5A4F|nr:imidazole glycerol phosphate synthase subunit HisH [Gynurincola endophyticus]
MKTVIIKYNAGNTQSVLYALERIGTAAIVSDDIETIQSADRVIFPGVGEASTAMAYLRERALDKVIAQLEQPVLGICLGMQLMCTHTTEGNVDCLGIFNTPVKNFGDLPQKEEHPLKVPQIGWNKVYDMQSPLFKNIPNETYFYFVHSYYAEICEDTIGVTKYIQPYTVALNRNNFYGVQFHPEKSADYGELLLKNFLDL